MRVLAACVTAAILAAGATAEDEKKDPKNDILGARWQFTAYEDKEVILEETFRATTDGKIWKGGTEIGTWKSVDKDTVTVDITKGKMAGTMKLELVNKKEKVYRGPWVPDKNSKVDGKKAAGKLKLIDD